MNFLLVASATFIAAMPGYANPLDPLYDTVANRCSDVFGPSDTQNDIFSSDTSSSSRRYRRAEVGARIWGIRAGGSGEGLNERTNNSSYFHDRSTTTVARGEDCSANVITSGEVIMNHQDNVTKRYQLRRERINNMLNW
ncbi:MAG: hypothetical protein LDL41_03735 [Coleofasciculus sp. S288]|nr:hypothetical protein [Coleofasciculus sp. S288]